MINRNIPPVPTDENLPRYVEEQVGNVRSDLWNTVNEDATFVGGKEFDSSADISGVWNFADGLNSDGTANFYDEVDFSSINVSGVVATLSGCTTEDSIANDLVNGSTYQANSDGHIYAYSLSGNAGDLLQGFLSDTTNADGLGGAAAGWIMQSVDRPGGNYNMSMNYKVAKDQYFEITKSDTATDFVMRWHNKGALNKPTIV